MLPLDFELIQRPYCFDSEMAHLPFAQDIPSQQSLHFKASLLLRQAENGSKWIQQEMKLPFPFYVVWRKILQRIDTCRLQLQDSMFPWPCLLWLQERANINYSPYALLFGESRELWSHGKPSTRSVFPLVSFLPIRQTQESTREQHCHLSSNATALCYMVVQATEWGPGSGQRRTKGEISSNDDIKRS